MGLDMTEKIAEKVSLVAGRVAIRGTEAIKNLVDDTEKLKTKTENSTKWFLANHLSIQKVVDKWATKER